MTIYCPECGTENVDNVVFCENCGFKIATTVPVRCKKCKKQYELKSDDNPSDFQCDCGGVLEYRKVLNSYGKHYDLKITPDEIILYPFIKSGLRQENKIKRYRRENISNIEIGKTLKQLRFNHKDQHKVYGIESDYFDEVTTLINKTLLKKQLEEEVSDLEVIPGLGKIEQYQRNAKKADILYKAYITDGISRLEKVNGRFLATQTLMLEKLIEQNNRIIELLEDIAKKTDK